MKAVVVDFDDFCDKHWCVNSLCRLKDHYPNFKSTLFTIPNKTSTKFLRVIKRWDWIELAVHGFNHNPNNEMMSFSKDQIIERLRKIDFNVYSKGFKAPGWHIHEGVVEACNELGLWIALHGDHDRELASMCAHGYYIVKEKGGSWHGHTHLDACNNYIAYDLPLLLNKWPKRQNFAFVSESLRYGISPNAFETRLGTNDLAIISEVTKSDCYRLHCLKKAGVDLKKILDVGAHIGSFLIFAKTLWPESKVRAYEPWDENFNLLEKNCSHYDGVELFRCAVIGDSDGHTWMRENPNPVNTGGVRCCGEELGRRIESTTLSQILSDWGDDEIDLLKTDCEGSEIPIFESAKRSGDLAKLKRIRGEYHGGEEKKKLLADLLSKTHEVKFIPSRETWGIFTAKRIE